MSDFDTEHASLFDPPLAAVERRERLSGEEFRTICASRTPVIITGMMDTWPAMQVWTTADGLRRRAVDAKVYYRNLHKGSTKVDGYGEVYEEARFGDFVDEVFADPDAGKYLTQATILRPQNYLCCWERASHPALLADLAADLVTPPYFPDDQIYEANLWIGPGSQNSGLHFDEMDNLNCLISGEKRWIMFPHSEHRKLMAGGGYRGSIARGFDAAEAERFAHPDRRRARGYECVVQRGETLFVPCGFWHQVFSGPGTSIAVNYWYLSLARMGTFLPLLARRYSGYGSRLRHTMAVAFLASLSLNQFRKYAMRRALGQEIPPPPLGPTGYRLRQI